MLGDESIVRAVRDFYDAWVPDLAPSEALVALAQKAADAGAWQTFVRRYRAEMKLLAALSRDTNLSVGCYCEDESRCHRSVLRELLREHGATLA